ncbi:MAG TPA: fumarylacetoacetate hydrolase family protein [Rhodocyclaceae bacterium]|nr:fumarylacetoacetate hydrolase family protein [Rhodocyclaceae bacterium]
MKLATLKNGGRDGTLVVVSRDLARCQPVPAIAATLQAALDDWPACAPRLSEVAFALDNDLANHAQPFDPADCHSPLPRAYQWADGSAYLNHAELVRRTRGATLPPEFLTEPLIYQGGSDSFVGPTDPIVAASEDWGIDFEGEVGVITGDVPIGASLKTAAAAIRLLLLINDVSLRELIPAELAKGFGFFQSKPASAFSPVAVTPDELGSAWRDHKLHLPIRIDLNGEPFGRPDAGVDMQFDFARLIAHAARTRALCAGTIIGSGTVSNRPADPANPIHTALADGGVGYACLIERRTIETLVEGGPRTPYLRFGDRVRIEMLDAAGASIFGAIDQIVAPSA